jgi:LPXTG-motif cell wall-anchored protein
MSPPFQRNTGESQETGLSFFVGLLALLIVAGALFRSYLKPSVASPAEYDDWEDSLGV